jgi:DNA-binding MarR family transcriptional regulator
MCIISGMPTDSELEFADQVGRHFARQYAMSPMVGRVLGYLLICDPPAQTAAEIAEALRASRSAIGQAVNLLETQPGFIQRTRAAGERSDRIAAHSSLGALEDPTEYVALRALAARGLEVLADAPASRRARLLELEAFADFLIERAPRMMTEWQERREALRASGHLPTPDTKEHR